MLLRNRWGRGELRPRWRRLQTSTTTSTVTLDTHEATLPPRGASARSVVRGNPELLAFIVLTPAVKQTGVARQRRGVSSPPSSPVPPTLCCLATNFCRCQLDVSHCVATADRVAAAATAEEEEGEERLLRTDAQRQPDPA